MPHSPPGRSARQLPWSLLILLGMWVQHSSALASPWEPGALRTQRAAAWAQDFERSATRLPEVAQVTATLQLPDSWSPVDQPAQSAQLDLRVQWQANVPPSRQRRAAEHLRSLASRTLPTLAHTPTPRITLSAAPAASLHAPKNVQVGPFQVAPGSALSLRLTLFGLLSVCLVMSYLVLKQRRRTSESRTTVERACKPNS